MSLEQKLIEFAESGNQQKIILADGQVLQGWVMEINADALLMSTGYHEKTGKDVWIELPQLSHAELQYWDNQHNMWKCFKL